MAVIKGTIVARTQHRRATTAGFVFFDVEPNAIRTSHGAFFGQKDPILSPLSVFFSENPLVRDIYNPLFHLFRYDKNGDEVRYGVLFNLFQEYRRLDTHELDLHLFFLLRFTKTPKSKSFSLLKGLFEYRKMEGKVSLRLFWLPARSPKQRKARGR